VDGFLSRIFAAIDKRLEHYFSAQFTQKSARVLGDRDNLMRSLKIQSQTALRLGGLLELFRQCRSRFFLCLAK
jgi:hypothetical protein